MRYRDATWPELPLSAWKDTYATLHLWTQIVGKIRLAQTPWLNHSWHVVLYFVVEDGPVIVNVRINGDVELPVSWEIAQHLEMTG